MQFKKKLSALAGWHYRSPRIFCILVLTCIYLFSLATLAPQASAATLSTPGGNVSDPAVRQVDIARPAVVRIITTIGGHLTVRFTATSQPVTFPLSGGSYPMKLSGSGAFISAHGELLTADHVVNPPRGQSLDDALYQYAAQDVADYFNSHFQASTGQQYTANDMLAFLANGSLPSTTAYDQPTSEVYLSTSYTGPINAPRLGSIPASGHATVDRIEAQSAFDANDVAIIHVSGMDNMPSIQLGDSGQVAEQDNLTIIGFPGLGDVSVSPTNVLTSSINKIYVSALKTTDSGSPVIQVGGNVEHGDSGGPALDDNGNIVGIVSFGLNDPNGTGETSFLQASNSARALIRSQGVNTAPGTFERAWIQAFNDYSSPTPGHWLKAAQELRNLATTYKGFAGIAPYLTFAQNQSTSDQGSSASTSTGLNFLIVVMILLLLLLLGAGALFMIVRRNPRPALVTPATHYPSMYSAYPQLQNGTPGAYAQQQNGHSGTYAPVAGAYPPGTVNGAYSPMATNYTSPAIYEQITSQIPETPRVEASAAPLSQFPAQGSPATPLPMQTPLPAEHEIAAHPLPIWAPPVQTPDAGIQSEPVQAEMLPATREESATPAPHSNLEESETVEGLPSRPRLLSSDSWPVVTPSDNGVMVPTAEDKTELAQPSARTFAVPRRPASLVAPSPETTTTVSSAGQYTQIAPCGHTNSPDVRFCRVCGQPVSTTGAADTVNGSEQ